MKQLLLATAAIAILGNAAPQRPGPGEPVQVDQIRADCPLTVTFGSYAMGIDGGTYDRVLRLLRNDRGVSRVEVRAWGREGEKTLCAVTRSSVDARRLFARVKGLFPRKPRGPLTVALRGGGEYHMPRR
ncbi:hypothetical protein OF829_10985 [Sphingomonas sp. LB-2]|uniref:hypothetical protein n=1 Tax=Sphingomonas caeni TaxID=2984949 RepID=UPI002232A9C6|nr:hypothetical protein [Sphingomonas caeni]MCW3847766.1 hypothetical protein [Sphingomonas caeni]